MSVRFQCDISSVMSVVWLTEWCDWWSSPSFTVNCDLRSHPEYLYIWAWTHMGMGPVCGHTRVILMSYYWCHKHNKGTIAIATRGLYKSSMSTVQLLINTRATTSTKWYQLSSMVRWGPYHLSWTREPRRHGDRLYREQIGYWRICKGTWFQRGL